MTVSVAGEGDEDRKRDRYQAHKAKMAARSAEASSAGREIGPLPPVADPERRASCETDLRLFLETYHPDDFELDWSDDHLELIAELQAVILGGGKKAFALPRASGKSTIARYAVQWAILYGHRHFCLVIGANDDKAIELLEPIILSFETDEILAEDFPEVCHPIQALEGIRNRCKGQTLDGEPTAIKFEKKKLVLPTVAGSKASGAVIKVGGIGTAVRGANHRTRDRRTIRPDLALIDDPQTRMSAESELQCNTLEKILTADVPGCAGPGKSIAILMACTVIEPGDAVDRLLDRELHPDWRGTRTKLLRAFPERMDLWEEYWEIFKRELLAGCRDAIPRACLEFYVANQEEMDRGADPSQPARFEPSEMTAVQNCMNLFLANPDGFASEYQNEPIPPFQELVRLTYAQLLTHTHPLPRGVVPLGVEKITAFIDVHQKVLVWMVCGWEPGFTGYVLDYGAFPDQVRDTFRVRNARPTLQDAFPGLGTDGSILKGIETLSELLCTRWFEREDGTILTVNRLGIDRGWNADTVLKFARRSPNRGLILPSFGRTFGPDECPMSRFKPKGGEKIGEEWQIKPETSANEKGRVNCLGIDTYHWKTFAARRLAVPVGEPGSLAWFGREEDGRTAQHKGLALHLDSEIAKPMRGERPVNEWTTKPGCENHWWDCLVSNAVLASVEGIQILQAQAGTGRRVTLQELRDRARAGK